MAGPAGVPNPGNPAQVAAISGAPVQPRQPAGPAETTAVPNPANPAQQQINQPAKPPVGAPGPYPGDTPNPGNPAQQQITGTPAQVGPVTVDPRDAAYYDQLARLNAANQGALLGYNRTTQQAQAGYDSTYGALTHQLGLTQQATRNQANSQGLLESGILGQRADLNNASYLGRVGQAQARLSASQQAAMDRLTGVQDAYGPRAKSLLDATTARAAAADLASGPTTPTPPKQGAARPRTSRGPRSAAVNTFGLGVTLTPHPAQTQTSGSGAVAHTTLGLNGTPTGRALANTAQQGINVFGLGGSLRKQAARRVVKGRG